MRKEKIENRKESSQAESHADRFLYLSVSGSDSGPSSIFYFPLSLFSS